MSAERAEQPLVPDPEQDRAGHLSVVPEVAESERVTHWNHREKHGLCYRTECVVQFGAPLIMERTTSIWR